MTGVHYVIAAYLGRRRIEDPRQVADRLFFIREHLASLQRLEHELAQITLVVNLDDYDAPRDTRSDRDLVVPHWIRGVRVEVVIRRNDPGWSYQALCEVADPRFTHTIFIEDDYIFTVDHFDRILVELFGVHREAVSPQTGTWRPVSLVCGLVRGEPMDPHLPHAAVSVGIMHSYTIASLASVVVAGLIPQLVWSRALREHGEPTDWLHQYATAYWHEDGVVRWFERHGKESLGTAVLGTFLDGDPFYTDPTLAGPMRAFVVPVQAMGRELEIMFWSEMTRTWARRPGRLDTSGVLTWLD